MKLYGSLTSPYVRKIRILIAEKSLPVEFVAQGPADPGSAVPGLNPLGKVPVLERDNGEALFDSPLIAEYLDSLQGEAMIPAAGEERWQVLRWQALAQGILDAVVARMLEGRREPAKQSPEHVQKQEGKVQSALDFAERHYPGGAYLVGRRLTLADIAMASALEYIDFRYAHDWRSTRPRLAAWMKEIGTRPSLVTTRPPEMAAPKN